jgi:hypothetical protein
MTCSDDVSVPQDLTPDLVPVDRRAVRRAEVVHGGEVPVELDVQVPPGNALVQQLKIGVGSAADDVAADDEIESLVGLINDEARARALAGGRRRLAARVGLGR